MFNKDTWTLGLIIGVFLPVLVYIPVILSFATYGHVDGIIYMIRPKTPVLIAIAANLFPLRYFMVNRKYDKTGRGILIPTFVYVLLTFSLL